MPRGGLPLLREAPADPACPPCTQGGYDPSRSPRLLVPDNAAVEVEAHCDNFASPRRSRLRIFSLRLFRVWTEQIPLRAVLRGPSPGLSLPFGVLLFLRSRSKSFRIHLRIRSKTFDSSSLCLPFAGNISSDIFVRIFVERSPAIWCAPPVIGASFRNDKDQRCSSLICGRLPHYGRTIRLCAIVGSSAYLALFLYIYKYIYIYIYIYTGVCMCVYIYTHIQHMYIRG